jgi:hypothetical protein
VLRSGGTPVPALWHQGARAAPGYRAWPARPTAHRIGPRVKALAHILQMGAGTEDACHLGGSDGYTARQAGHACSRRSVSTARRVAESNPQGTRRR